MATANRLTDILAQQLEVLNELQKTLHDEQKAIAGLDTPLMEVLNSQKELLIVRQRNIAESLRTVLAETAGQLGLPASVTLSEMLEKMPASLRAQVEPLQQSVKQTGSAVSVLANQNRGMLERFLGVVNESLSFILRILNTSNTYGVRGTYLNNTQSGAVMVNREA
ncbi:flagellar protein FlgN [Trichlorobacter lovleyi]|uniref:flagellar protein FlgN n=1 Tax=Trichlorobacter lovleyi TaxID=313985 RepID=UPI00223FE1E3|nr:flagellar protein FlgN [Trichlorobacter lovleyi]QOX80253.1 flagellar protein FlgN [Trichlorobacter lovleyi]